MCPDPFEKHNVSARVKMEGRRARSEAAPLAGALGVAGDPTGPLGAAGEAPRQLRTTLGDCRATCIVADARRLIEAAFVLAGKGRGT